MPDNQKPNGQRSGKGQAADARTGRDEDDHVVVPPRTGSVYEEDADGMTAQPEQPYDANARGQTKRPPSRGREERSI